MRASYNADTIVITNTPDATRLVAWNIRAGGGQRADAIARQLLRWRADVVALCEFRASAPSQALATSLRDGGLTHHAHTTSALEPSANRLLIAARWPIEPLQLSGAPEQGGRWLAARIVAPRPFTLIAVHVPNRVSGHKWPFHDAALHVVRGWAGGPALLVGDTNTGRIGIDEAPGAAGFIAREDAWMQALDTAGWRDAFRHRHGARRSWTWYSPNAGNGYRLDQAFINAALIDRLVGVRHAWGRTRAQVRRDALSDHAALIVDLA